MAKKESISAKAKQKKDTYILVDKPILYWQVQKDAFIGSFRNIATKKFLGSALFDLFTLLSILLVVICFLSIINYISIPLIPSLMQAYTLSNSGDTTGAEQILSENYAAINSALWISLGVGIVAFLLSLFFISLFYHRAWDLARDKKASGKSFFRKFTINLLWALFWFLLLFLTSLVFQSTALPFVVLLEMIFFYYADPVLRAVFDGAKSIRSNIGSFAKTAAKFHWFIFFILTSFILFLLIMLFMSIFNNNQLAFAFALFIFVLLLLGWARNYVLIIVKAIS